MQLVSCRKCGKENIVGSWLCGNCGNQLTPAYIDMRGESSSVTCPTCNSSNPAGATTCRVCGQPLPATSATPPASSTGGSRLSRLAAARRQKEAAEGKSAREEGGDWFSNLRSDESFADSYAASTAADALENSAETVQLERDDVALFASFSGDPAEPQLRATPEAENVSPPLFATTNETQPIMPTVEPAEVSPPLFKAPSEDSLPDWLKAMNAQSSAAPATPEPPTSPAPAEEGLPDWLRDMNSSAGETETSAPPPTSPVPESVAPDVPDWLREAAPEPKPEPTPPARPRSGQTTQFPPWLQQTTGNLGGAPRGSYSDQYVDQLMDFAFDEPATPNPVLPGIADEPDSTRPVGFASLFDNSPAEPPAVRPSSLPASAEKSEPQKIGRSFTDLPFLAESEDLPPLPSLSLPIFNEAKGNDATALKPWLIGLPLPSLPIDENSSVTQLKPWLIGLPLPALPEDDLASTEAPTALIVPTDTKSARRASGNTRPFSVSNLFDDQEEDVKTGVPAAPTPPAPTPLNLSGLFDDEDEPATEVVPFAPPSFEGREAIVPPGQPRLTELTNGETPDLEFELRGLFGEAKIGSGGSTPPSPTPPAPTPPPAPEPDLPDFLQDSPTTSAESATPSWLNSSTEPATPAWLEETDKSSSNDFLQELGAAPAEPATPDWLQDLGATSEPALASQSDTLPDWLGGPAEDSATQAPQDSPQPASSTDSLDFLREEADSLSAEPAASDEEIPDWLQALTSGTLVTAGPKPTTSYTPMSMGAATVDESSIPDWLREEGNSAGSATPNPPVTVEQDFTPAIEPQFVLQDSEEVPDWLGNMDAITPPPSVPAIPATPPEPTPAQFNFEADDSMPDWLRDSAEPVSEPPFVPSTPPPFDGGIAAPETNSAALSEDFFPFAGNDSEVANMLQTIEQENVAGSVDLPDWLHEKPAASDNEPLLNLSADLPDWLHEGEAASPTLQALDDLTGPGTSELKERPVASEPPAMRPGTNEFSSLLGDISSTTVESFSGGGFLGDADGPAWLRNSKPNTAPLPEATPTESPGALPSWLRSVAPAAVEEEVIPSAVGLSTLPGLEQSGVGFNTNYAVETPALPSVVLPPELASTAVLKTLLTAQVVPATSPQPDTEEIELKRRLRPALLVRLGLSIVLLLLALLALFVPLPFTTLPATTPQVQAFFDKLEGLTPESKVLVVYDYEADRSGEMHPIAQSVTQHVLSKRVRLLNFSLNPQGPALASLVTDELIQKEPYGNSAFYRYGTNYLNLGWRPGNEVAVRSLFGQLGDLHDYKKNSLAKENPVMQGINSLSDLNLIVVLAGDESNVRAWVEQAGIQPGTQIVFAVPQAIEAIVRPYTQVLPGASEVRDVEKQPRTQALLAGLPQAYQYEALLRGRNIITEQRTGGDLDKRVAAQSLAALFLIVVIGGANVYYFVRRREQ